MRPSPQLKPILGQQYTGREAETTRYFWMGSLLMPAFDGECFHPVARSRFEPPGSARLTEIISCPAATTLETR
jgi:hypothetical protein